MGTEDYKYRPMSEEEAGLARLGTDPATHRKILATRAITMLLLNPEQSMRPERIAERLGIDSHTVIELMSTPEYQEIVRDQCQSQVASQIGNLLSRTQQVLDEDLTQDDPHKKLSASFLLKMLETMGRTYKTLADASPKQAASNTEDALDKFLNGLKRPSVTVTDS